MRNDVATAAAPEPIVSVQELIATLRSQLREPNVKSNGLAVAKIAGTLNRLRDSK